MPASADVHAVPGRGLAAGLHAELAENVGDVPLDRVQAEVEGACDQLVAVAGRDAGKDLEFARGERAGGPGAPRRTRARGFRRIPDWSVRARTPGIEHFTPYDSLQMLGYTFVAEPLFGVKVQSVAWSLIYVVYAGLVVASWFLLRPGLGAAADGQGAAPEAPTVIPAAS